MSDSGLENTSLQAKSQLSVNGLSLRAVLSILGSHFLPAAAVAILSFWLISTASNPNIALSFDQAEYVGAARDFLETGVFIESTHSRSLGALLPLGYPTLIGITARMVGWSPHQAALNVNVAAGVVLSLLTYWLLWRMTASRAWALLGGLLIAGHGMTVLVAGRAMTDTVYACLFTALSLLTISSFAKDGKASPLVLGGLAGLVTGGMYFLRISAFFLLPGLPFIWILLNLIRKKMAWARLFAATCLFLFLAGSVVLAVTWRFHSVNGGWNLSPQVAFNARMGDFKAGQQGQIWTLDDQSQLVIKNAKAVAGESAWEAAASMAAALARNLHANLLFIKDLAAPAPGVSPRLWWGLAILLAAFIAGAHWLGRDRPKAGQVPSGSSGVNGEVNTSKPFAPAWGWIAPLIVTSLAILYFLISLRAAPYLLGALVLLVGACVALGRPILQGDTDDGAVRPEPRLEVGLGVTGALCLMHLLAYSLLNAKDRYMAQAYPLLVAFCLGLAFWLLGRDQARLALSSVSTWLRPGPGRLGATLPKALLASAGLVALLFLGGMAVLQANATLAMARKYQAVTAQSPNAVKDAGLLIEKMAHERGLRARVAQDDSGVAYYAHGDGYIVPYLETRPDRLLRFLAVNEIFFVTCQPFTAFGQVYTGIGLRHLMEALVAGEHPGVQWHQAGQVFSMQAPLKLRLLAHGENLPSEGLPISTSGFYLLWLDMRGQALATPKQYKNVSSQAKVMLDLRAGSQRKSLAGGALCPGPRLLGETTLPSGGRQKEEGEFSYYQAFRVVDQLEEGSRPWRVTLSPDAPKDLRIGNYWLYAIE